MASRVVARAFTGSAGLVLLATVSLYSASREWNEDPRLKTVSSIFVSGNNQAAEGARNVLRNGKTCFTLAGSAPAADAVLEVGTDSQTQGGQMGGFGARTWIASATLTLKGGDLIWSHSERFGDAPLMKSGGKTTGEMLVRHLARAASCKARQQ